MNEYISEMLLEERPTRTHFPPSTSHRHKRMVPSSDPAASVPAPLPSDCRKTRLVSAARHSAGVPRSARGDVSARGAV